MYNFFDVCKEIQGYTLITPDRLWALWSWVNDTVMSLEGSIAELGSYKGGSAKLLARAIGQSRSLHVFDTFEGVPASMIDTKKDYVMEDHPHLNISWADGKYEGGEWVADYEHVKSFLQDCRCITPHKGIVPEILKEVENDKFCFVHLDMDIYEPTVAALEFFWTRLISNGVIICDDYRHLLGVTNAVEEFATKQGVKVLPTAYMQCAIRKP